MCIICAANGMLNSQQFLGTRLQESLRQLANVSLASIQGNGLLFHSCAPAGTVVTVCRGRLNAAREHSSSSAQAVSIHCAGNQCSKEYALGRLQITLLCINPRLSHSPLVSRWSMQPCSVVVW